MKAKDVIQDMLFLRDYWAKTCPTDSKEAIDGFIHSFLCMCDGDAGINDFQSITFVDDNKVPVYDGMPYHEQFHMLNNKE